MMTDVQKSLLLCRTPLQAYLCEHLVRTGVIADFDVFYVTHQNHEADGFYFANLARHALRSTFLFQRPLRLSIFTNLAIALKIRQFIDGASYSCIYLASIDSFPFGYALKSHRGAIVTFDDGAGNVITPGRYDPQPSPRDRLYRRVCGLPSPESIAEDSSAHFTIYEDLPNIVEASRRRFIEIFPSNAHRAEPATDVRFFLGQPFLEYLSQEQVRRLKHYLAGLRFDYYVPHPRERALLTNRFPVLATAGRLGEMAILEAACGAKPVIYSCFSSILLNLHASLADKYYLSLADSPLEARRRELATATGCQVIEID